MPAREAERMASEAEAHYSCAFCSEVKKPSLRLIYETASLRLYYS
jgi:hypothetical protein